MTTQLQINELLDGASRLLEAKDDADLVRKLNQHGVEISAMNVTRLRRGEVGKSARVLLALMVILRGQESAVAA